MPQKSGVERILGIDGDWVAKESLVIPRENFLKRDLRSPLGVNERLDLAISVEVAEHLPAVRADQFVHNLAAFADFVLFSAAIPGQGGVNHLNEQWLEN